MTNISDGAPAVRSAGDRHRAVTVTPAGTVAVRHRRPATRIQTSSSSEPSARRLGGRPGARALSHLPRPHSVTSPHSLRHSGWQAHLKRLTVTVLRRPGPGILNPGHSGWPAAPGGPGRPPPGRIPRLPVGLQVTRTPLPGWPAAALRLSSGWQLDLRLEAAAAAWAAAAARPAVTVTVT